MKITKEEYGKLAEKVASLEKALNGGKGSGNFGHTGRPGKIGGSGNGQGETVVEKEEIKVKMSKDEARTLLDEVADEVMGGSLSDYSDDWENLIDPLVQGRLTRKQVTQLMRDGKPELTSEKTEIFFGDRGHLRSRVTWPEASARHMEAAKRYWEERHEDH